MLAITSEIASQPALWRKAAAMAPAVAARLPARGGSAVAIGCGTSHHIARAYATLREERNLGTTDAVIASELSPHRSLVWAIGPVDPGVLADTADTGATVVDEGSDPMAELVLIQRMAVELAEAHGLDPDRPKHLTRSVVLP
jgi:fructoselysine-6-P-deglycase FrlB-like protein